ncbi:hypothetical protein ACQKGC_20775 [Allorhizobium pseudoryzae]|uniref:hypothetical protein n=1 Tax=Allorhizobium pseudoryzae TaxID=379684 RepID=UPI003D02B5FE
MTEKASVQVPQEVWQRLQTLSRKHQRDIGEMAAEALSDYLDELEKDQFGADEAVSNDSVIRWLETWGTEDELPPPKAERHS